MSRTVRYILTIVLIIAAAMWLLTVYRSCEKTKKDNTEITTDNTGTENTNTTTIDSSGLEDLYEEEGHGDLSDDSGNAGNSGSTSGDESDEEEDDLNTGDGTSVGSGTENDGFENRTGNYLVVAGAFVAKSNADHYQKQLTKKGYNAEVRIFLGSDYHSVILGDYATEREALTVAKKLGGEAYVHKRRFPKKK